MFNRKVFAQRLSKLREERNLTMSDLAKAIGVSRPAISQFESSINLPSLDTLIVLVDYFDVSLDYLVGRSDDPRRR